MSESEEDNEHFCFYGKPLEQFDEEAVPRKRPISVEEQIATDAQGRRRFHGAFTGGFSAGFFNTVGSLEGWLPGEFKSSRLEKSETVTQKPEDFMDDEDLGEDGIAPQVVRATKEYNTNRKRRKQVFSEGPIPGEPVLHNILTSGNETIGYMLLKNLRIKDKKKKQVEQKTYGCQMPVTEDLFDSSAEQQYEIPELYKEFLAKPKDNTFGLGYSGLDKSHFSLFPTAGNQQFKAVSGDKKFSISGQAFGVGAFEEEDDDIYVRDDMSKYDFELKSERDEAKARTEKSLLVLGLFERSKEVLSSTRKYPAPTIPHSFTGKHRVKKSRFEPVPEEKPAKINPMIRAKYLGEEVQEDTVSEADKPPENCQDPGGLNDRFVSSKNNTETPPENSSYLNDRFVSSGKKEDVGDILEVVEKTDTIHGTSQMREAARMKMFGPLTRITSDWSPSTLLCKRFNVPEPFVDRPEKSRTRTKNIIFEYQKHQEEINLLQPGLKKEEPATPTVNETEETKNSTEPMEEDKEETRTTNEDNKQNQPKDLTEPIHLEEQQDLFKAIFLSDSEDEEESEETAIKNEDQARKEEMKSSVLSDQLIPKIKPLKEGGILSGINFVSMKKREETNKEETEKDKEKGEEKSNLYGPKMPEMLVATPRTNPISVKVESEDEWVEKNDSDSDDEGKRRKEKKKHKKEKKHKHKKHKHKKKH